MGTHRHSLHPLFLLLSYANHSLQLRDLTSSFTPLPTAASAETILSGFTVECMASTLYVLGGGGVFFWMPHFNESIQCPVELACLAPATSQCFMDRVTSRQKRPRVEKEEETEAKEECVLLVSESKKVGLRGDTDS